MPRNSYENEMLPFDNFQNAIYFHCGDLDLLPRPT